jgi:hypothetical protein
MVFEKKSRENQRFSRLHAVKDSAFVLDIVEKLIISMIK